jgi:hypothetical protein
MGTLIYEDDSGEEHVLASSPDLNWRAVEITSSALLHYASSMEDGTERRRRRMSIAGDLGMRLEKVSYEAIGPEKMSPADERRHDEFVAAEARRRESSSWQ